MEGESAKEERSSSFACRGVGGTKKECSNSKGVEDLTKSVSLGGTRGQNLVHCISECTNVICLNRPKRCSNAGAKLTSGWGVHAVVSSKPLLDHVQSLAVCSL